MNGGSATGSAGWSGSGTPNPYGGGGGGGGVVAGGGGAGGHTVISHSGSDGMDCVIVNYRTPQELTVFLQSIELITHSNIVAHWSVVNVDPTPADLKVAEEWVGTNPYRHHLTIPTNVGYAAACNIAAIMGWQSAIGFFNSDMRILPAQTDVLDSCMDLLFSHTDIAVVGPRQVDERGRITHGGIFGTLAAPRPRGWMQVDKGQFSDVAPAVTVSGSAYIIKRHVWQTLTHCPIYQKFTGGTSGAFLPTPHYYEETACSYHAKAHGYEIMYNGDAVMEHRWHRSSPVGGVAEREHMPKSRTIFRDFCNAHGIQHD